MTVFIKNCQICGHPGCLQCISYKNRSPTPGVGQTAGDIPVSSRSALNNEQEILETCSMTEVPNASNIISSSQLITWVI
jgi:hypothetical protein